MSRFVLLVLVWSLPIWGFAQEPAVKPKAKPTTWLPAPSPIEAKVRAKLDQRCDINFNDTPLSDAIQFLQDVFDVPLRIDLEVPVTLEKEKVPLRETLSLILAQHNLTYLIEDGAVKIVSVATDRGRYLMRTYPVDDLVEKKEEATLIKSIKEAVGADAWNDKGGGSVEYDQKSQSLIIRQTFSAHEKIIDLLQKRRLAIAEQK